MLRNLVLATVAAFGLSAAANAALPVYPDAGTINPVDYSFTASADGDIVAYFAGHSAGYTNYLRLLVNGVDTGIEGLNNQTSALGESLNFGAVQAGDVLTFAIRVSNTGDFFYSDRNLNADGITHIYSAPYAGGDFGIPAGVYVGFEDILGGGDKDYDDLRFVFTNVSGGAVPEPATWAMLIAGFGLVGFAARRRRTMSVTTA
ncbi:PEPxxWA-CTERM sorting domain-containing protein [Sandaracinobacteroides sp. A072]|uniref:PEPxxWA-CTERM sorting domain-containing protein n=1 Tax=Sandaracinobacteroides sp. A072 TaxID=3461146 RepID=UPI004041511A